MFGLPDCRETGATDRVEMVNFFKVIAAGARKIIDSVQGLAVEPATWQKPAKARDQGS